MNDTSNPIPSADVRDGEGAWSLSAIRAWFASDTSHRDHETLRRLVEGLPDDLDALHATGELLIDQGAPGVALAIARDGLQRHPDAPSLLLLDGKAMLEQFRSDGASSRDVSARAKTSERVVACCRKLIDARHYEQAVELATRALELFKKDGRFALLHSRALIGAARYDEAQDVLVAYRETFPSQPRLKTLHCRCLLELGRHREAADLSTKILEAQPNEYIAQVLRCRALLEYGDFEKAEQQADIALSSRPGDTTLLTVKGRALLEQGRGGEFCSALTPSAIPGGGSTTALWNVYARSLEQAGRWQEIVDWLEPVVTGGGEVSPGVFEALSLAYNRLGRTDKAEEIYRKLSQGLSKIVPDDLVTGLKDARSAGPSSLPNSTLTAHVLDRLWELADQTKWTREAWTDRLRWGGGAQRILRNLIMVRSKRAHEVVALTDYVDMAAYKQAVASGRSCLITGAHYGAYGAVAAMFMDSGVPTCLLSKFAIPQEDLPDNVVRVTASSHPRLFVKAIQQAVSEGRIIIVSGDIDTDLGAADKGYRLNLFGQDVSVASMPTRLAYQFKLPSIWLEGLFAEDRFQVRSRMLMPPPRDGERRDAFAERWWAAYLDEMTRVLRYDPSNLYFESGPVRRALLQTRGYASWGATLDVKVNWPGKSLEPGTEGLLPAADKGVQADVQIS